MSTVQNVNLMCRCVLEIHKFTTGGKTKKSYQTAYYEEEQQRGNKELQ